MFKYETPCDELGYTLYEKEKIRAKNVFQKYCGANISSAAKSIFNLRKSI